MPDLQNFVYIKSSIRIEGPHCNICVLNCSQLCNVKNIVNPFYGVKLAIVLFAHLTVAFVVQLVVRSSTPRRAQIVAERK